MDNVIEVDLLESWWDYLQDGATLVLAIVNVVLIYIIYKWQHKDTTVTEERQRRVNQFNNIFLIPRMDYLKKVFDELFTISSKFEQCVEDDDKKNKTNDEIDGKIKEFEDNFVSFIAGIDSGLQQQVHGVVEDMRDGLAHDIFDTNTKDITGAAYVQKIQKRINTGYKNLLTALFGYDGNIKDSKEKNTKESKVFLYIILGIITILLGSLVYRNYTTPVAPDKVTIQLDSTQMKSIIDVVQNDTLKRESN